MPSQEEGACSSVPVIVLGGATCSGKSTLTRSCAEWLKAKHGLTVKVFNQDDYFRPNDEQPIRLPDLNHWHFDVPEAINFAKLVKDVTAARNSATSDVVVVEGNMVTECTELTAEASLRYFVELDHVLVSAIRSTRSYDPPDIPGYFERYVWPAYLEHRASAHRQHSIAFLRGLEHCLNQQTLQCDILRLLRTDWLLVTDDALPMLDAVVRFVTEHSCGAIETFSGTTRDNFDGKPVAHLTYEAYTEMAYKCMGDMCVKLRQLHPEVRRIAIHHRLGEVGLGERSITIAASSPHRNAAQEATKWLITEAKCTLPIWKKEVYDTAGGDWAWKANAESVEQMERQSGGGMENGN